MKKNKVLLITIFLILYINIYCIKFYLPINVENRKIFKQSYLTNVGDFGIWRKPYNGLKGHYHTGIDFKNPGKSVGDLQPIFACAEGKVISIYSHGPSSTIIISHNLGNKYVYSVYTHVSNIVVLPGDTVDHYTVIASFIDKPHLDTWGEYLNHLHFEILKIRPKYAGKYKGYDTYSSYSVSCFTKRDLFEKFYNPEIFFEH